jgi:hypothetical protein
MLVSNSSSLFPFLLLFFAYPKTNRQKLERPVRAGFRLQGCLTVRLSPPLSRVSRALRLYRSGKSWSFRLHFHQNTGETLSAPHESDRTPDRCFDQGNFSSWLRFKAGSGKTARCRVVLREGSSARTTSVRLLTGATRPRSGLCPTRFRHHGTAQGVRVGLHGSGRHDWLLFGWIGRGAPPSRNNQSRPCVPVPRDLACRCFHGRARSFFSRARASRRNSRLDPACAFRGRRSEALCRNRCSRWRSGLGGCSTCRRGAREQGYLSKGSLAFPGPITMRSGASAPDMGCLRRPRSVAPGNRTVEDRDSGRTRIPTSGRTYLGSLDNWI